MSSEANEISSAPITPRPAAPKPPVAQQQPPVSCPPSQYNSPSLSRSPLLEAAIPADNHRGGGDEEGAGAIVPSKTPKGARTPLGIRTPRMSLTPMFLTPLGSPVRKALRATKLDPEDAWLPITESRNGNKYYAAFHTLCSGIGIQALVLPVAFTILGW